MDKQPSNPQAPSAPSASELAIDEVETAPNTAYIPSPYNAIAQASFNYYNSSGNNYPSPPSAFSPPPANINDNNNNNNNNNNTNNNTSNSNSDQPSVVMPIYGQVPVYENKHTQRLQNFVFVATLGKIRALELTQGAVRTVWNEELKGCGYHMVHLHLHAPRGQLYAATNGHVFSFDALDGKQIWHVKPPSQHGIINADLVTLLLTFDGSILISASNGAIVAFNAINRQIIWQYEIERMVGSFGAYALLEHRGILYVGNEGHVYALHMINGQLKWKNELSGFGSCHISLAAYDFAPPGGVVYDILFVGTYGYILALDGQTGATRHHVNLDGTGYKPVVLLLDPPTDTLYTATSGELRCFRAESMQQIWKSDLPGMGYSFGHSLLFTDLQTVGIGMHGNVAALDKTDRRVRWKVSLPGCGYHLVTVAPMANPNMLVCASSGKLYGIDKTGRVLWQDGLPGMGYAECSISTTVFNTDFNSTTLPQNIEMQRRQNKKNTR